MNQLLTQGCLRPLFVACLAAVSFPNTSWALSPPNITTDIDWNAGVSGVADIATAYNNARRQEEIQLGITANTLGNLILPSQAVWDGMSDDAKALYILNAERTARANMLPDVLGLAYEGIATAVDTVAQDYADLLIANDAFSHDENGSPSDRLDNAYTLANPGSCREFMTRTENLAVFVTSQNSIPLAIERSIYNWIYDDASSAWGHREAALLQDSPLSNPTETTWGYENNHGSTVHEGFLGIGRAGGNNYQGPFSSAWNYAEVVVMNIIDPVASGCSYTVTVRTEDLPAPATDNTPDAVDDSATTTTGVPVTIQLADNDTSLDGITITIASGPSSGTVGSVQSDNSIIYSPNSGFSGHDSFTYTLTDDDGDTDTATVTITVNAPANTDPVANDDISSVQSGQSVSIDVLNNDTDADGDTLSISTVGSPSNGTATQSGNSIIYTPTAGFVGNDSFTYTISDSNGGTATGTVNITVTEATNNDPIAVDDSATIVQNQTIDITVLDNDSDSDGDTLTVSTVSTPANGVASIVNNQVRYTPVTNFTGSDALTYTLEDGQGGSATATINITVDAPVNLAPTATDDLTTVDENQSVIISILDNDTDPENDLLAVSLVTDPQYGTATIMDTAGITVIKYTPDTDYTGEDSFTYQVDDGHSHVSTATVHITVEAATVDPERGPIAHWPLDDGSGTVAQDSSGYNQTGTLINAPNWSDSALAFDGMNDYVNVGTLDVTGEAMTLSAWFKADQLNNCASHDCRIISKATGTSSDAHYWMVSTIRVGNTTHLRFRLKTNNTTTTLIANSGDIVEGEWVHVTAVYDGSEMRLYKDGTEVGSRAKTGAISTDATVPVWIGGNPPSATSRPWQGLISDVCVFDRALTQDAIQALIAGDTPPAENHIPTATDDTVSTNEEQSITFDVLSNDASADGIASISIEQTSNHGAITVNPDNTLTYTPDNGFSGSDNLIYRITDTDGDSTTANVNITVHAATLDQAPGLIAHWPLNEGNGTTVADISGNAHNGALINNPGWASSSVQFDGENDYIHTDALDVVGEAMTLSAWFKADQLNNCSSHDCRIISKANGTSNNAHYWMVSTIRSGNTTRLRFRLKTNGVTTTLIANSGDIIDGEWVHVSAVYDGSEMRLYKDGVEVGSQAKAGTISTDATVPVWIGGNPPSATSRPWQGQISDVRIYNQALTVVEIQTVASEYAPDMNTDNNGDATDNPDGLIGHWPLDDGSGNIADDLSGNNHTGTLLNNPLWSTSGLSFDGIDDYVGLGALDIPGEALTLSAWFKADQLSNCNAHDCRIISKANGTSNNAHYWMVSTIRVGNTTRLRFRLKTNGVTTTLIASSGDIVDGEWVHVTAVYDGSRMRLYKDGAEVGSQVKTGSISTHSSVPAWIGGNPLGATDRPWQGDIRDVRIYNQALNATAIQALTQE